LALSIAALRRARSKSIVAVEQTIYIYARCILVQGIAKKSLVFVVQAGCGSSKNQKSIQFLSHVGLRFYMIVE
jgi:hypothetical protein